MLALPFYLCTGEAFAASAVYNYTDGTVVDVSGPLSIRSDDSCALDAQGGGEIRSSFDVSVSGDNSYALYAQDNSKITVDGNVAVEGDVSFAVCAQTRAVINIGGGVIVSGEVVGGTIIRANDSSHVGVSGDIAGYGDWAVGVAAEERSTVIADKDIFVSGDGSVGINAWTGSVVSAGRDLTVLGKDAIAAHAQEGGKIKVDGDILVSGDYAYGLWGSEAGSLKIGGSVHVSGDYSHGANMSERGAADIGGGLYVSGYQSVGGHTWAGGGLNVSGDIVVEGFQSKGVYAWAYSAINVDGMIYVSGDYVAAALVDEGSLINVGGGIYAYGENAHGIDASNFSQANIYGGVLASGDFSSGVSAWFADTSVYVDGDVSALGTLARAAHAWDSAVVDINGNVYASGEGAIGAFAWEKGVISIVGDLVVEGGDSYAAHTWRDGSTINIDGSVSISGDNAIAAFAEETSVINIQNGTVTSRGSDNTTLLVQFGGLISLDSAAARTEGGILVKTEDFGSIYAVNGSSMTGDVINLNEYHADETLNLTLDGGSSLRGSINDLGAEAVTDVTLSDRLSVWHVTDVSTINGTLENHGTVDFRSAQTLIKVTVENLDAGMAAGGTFAMKAEVAKENADLLKVTGASSGSYTIKVDNDGREATKGTEVTLLAETADRNSDFVLAHLVERGVWTYDLRRNTTDYGSGSGAGWELYAVDISEPGSDAINTYRASYMLNYAETTLIQRMGDLRESPQLRGVWARFYGGEFEAKSHGAGKAKNFEMSYGGLHIGYDRKLEIGWDGDFYLGVTAGYSAGDLDLRSGGDSDVKSYMVGMYGTFMHPNGFYLDAVLKYRWKNSEFNTYDSTGDYVKSDSISTSGLGWSVEFGQRISFNGTPKDGWYAEPQVQLRYQRQGAGHYSLSNGLRIGADGVTSVIGRLGILVGHEKGDRNYYAKLFRLKEFDGELNVWTGDHDYLTTQRLGGSWWVYGIGLTSKVNDRNYLYCDIERTAGSNDFQQKWRLNAGWRHEI